MKWYLMCLLVVHSVSADKIFNTKSGPVKGIKFTSQYEQKEFYSLRGIPYAKPPIGSLRFKPPVPHDGWKNTLDAFEFGNLCVQVTQIGQVNYLGDEDCLTLNIYTPVNAKNVAVLFCIHGGGFVDGSGNDFFYGPDFLINEDIILVTMNYRLGPLGFMSLGTPDISGNMGLKDIILALKWVNENIENFGGDPKKITIFGQSAGGGAAHLVSLSPSAMDLFNRAFIISGSALNTYILKQSNNHTEIAYKLAKDMGQPAVGYDSLLKFFQSIDPKDLITKTVSNYATAINDGKIGFKLVFGPVIENVESTDAVITLPPEDYILKDYRENIDLMFGYAGAESFFQLSPVLSDPSLLNPIDENFLFDLPRRDFENEDYNSKRHKKARFDAKKFYFGSNAINIEQIDQLTEFVSDLEFVYGVERSIIAESQRKGNTYYYMFNGIGRLNTLTTFMNLKYHKATHVDDLCYMFKCKAFDQLYDALPDNSNERNLMKNMASILANFAKDGKPKSSNRNIKWNPVVPGKVNMIEIGTDSNIAHVNKMKNRIEFWDNLLEEYGKSKA